MRLKSYLTTVGYISIVSTARESQLATIPILDAMAKVLMRAPFDDTSAKIQTKRQTEVIYQIKPQPAFAAMHGPHSLVRFDN